MASFTRSDVVDYLLKTNLLRRCVECQVVKMKDKQFMDDIEQDAWVWIMTYDEEKLINAYTNGHLNALISRYLINNLFSKTSPFYKTYLKQSDREDEITQKLIDTIPDED